MGRASFLASQAVKCRRLARGIDDNRTAKGLLELADEFDVLASAAAIEEAHGPTLKIQDVSV
jgi:hypothetical protein